LSRTAIEGGRTGYSKYGRRFRTDEERAYVRGELRKLLADVDLGDDLALEPRDVWYRDFADKLGPPRRWLHKQVGRLWADVYSDLKRSFDPRTTAGRHLVYDHMLRWIDRGEASWYGFRELYVDNDGVLRAEPRKPRVRSDWSIVWNDRKRAEIWAAGRKIGERGSCRFWFVRADRDGLHYRQDRRLDIDETAFWNRLHAEVRKELLYVVDGGRSSWDVSRLASRLERSSVMGSIPVRPAALPFSFFCIRISLSLGGGNLVTSASQTRAETASTAMRP
jgi:hypothetical protein